ncbi:MAG: hypothetical protein P0Y53_24545 [Candidatus Pseudobacter hemicellulosilyticus]|uniref:Alpha-galactosidase n=1 Tax=Candidatus Pseudobacter hemicellulosilyticus TaxID=3121375 RepID=A0AAJ5WU40_9BACT|nr:MAG: hypothetical protein P0Y53_24545 [Pseudobacter sp.]
MIRSLVSAIFTLVLVHSLEAQNMTKYADSLVLQNGGATVVFHTGSGAVDYRFAGGPAFAHTGAYVELLPGGWLRTRDFSRHTIETEKTAEGLRVLFTHADNKQPVRIIQSFIMTARQPQVLVGMEVVPVKKGQLLETRNISPFALVSAEGGQLVLPGTDPRLLDVPFDNDNWTDAIEQRWESGKAVSGISYEFASGYDQQQLNGFVIGTVQQEFWKTGIRYQWSGTQPGVLDSLVLIGGAVTADNRALPLSRGGFDGTHDVMPHGSMKGTVLKAPSFFLGGSADVRKTFVQYGQCMQQLSGSLSWKDYAPFYWNSFGVEGVLGYHKKMMPEGVRQTSDFIHSLENFNRYGQPVLSIDSYDGGVYTPEVLRELGQYGQKNGQQMGFYFIPFACWTWKNAMENTKLAGSDYKAADVVLRDPEGKVVPYKDGEWGAYPLDPTHPAVRAMIIHNLQKAKFINAKFLKIDFLSAGALESARRYDTTVRSGMQAYSQGMKLLKHLIDSIMGPDIFITLAISPMFPHQYAHTRFVSTDVYSHLRNDMPGFPHYGSTQNSLSNGTHYWWMQGTLWPYTNMDVAIMKNFQEHGELNEQEIKVRLYAMMVMGSILGDGSDLRHPIAAMRAQQFLDNPAVCAFFSRPKVFTPLHFSDGETGNQRLAFYLPGDTTLLGLFNFYKEGEYHASLSRLALQLKAGAYELRDFMTDAPLGKITNNDKEVRLTIPAKAALMVRLIPVQE